MKYSPSMIPQFVTRLEQASSEQEIQSACQEIKSAVQARWKNESTRRKPMSEIRKAVRDRFPEKPCSEEKAPFPYCFTNSGKGRISRWEHLAIKGLREEWNPQVDWSDVEHEDNTQMVKTDMDILGYVGLEGEELEAVKQALGEADVKEWVKQALLQRANSINALRSRIEEDLSEVPSESLMSDKKYRSSPSAARELVDRAVRVVKLWNLDYPDQKWCITNKVISELTGVTVKAVAKAVEGMDIASYNQAQGLEPLINRFTKAAVGNPSEVMSVALVTGVEGSENLEKSVQVSPVQEKVKRLDRNASMMDIFEFLGRNRGYKAQIKADGKNATYEAVWGEDGRLKAAKCLEDGMVSEVR